jgi:hypothetical protein
VRHREPRQLLHHGRRRHRCCCVTWGPLPGRLQMDRSIRQAGAQRYVNHHQPVTAYCTMQRKLPNIYYSCFVKRKASERVTCRHATRSASKAGDAERERESMHARTLY